ncbi:MAG: hypothetical protein AB1510_04795 [Bacillota bacterium]
MPLPFVIRPRRKQPLLEEFHRVLELVRIRHKQFNFCDMEFVDTSVFNISAAESRLTAILQQARQQGITAW